MTALEGKTELYRDAGPSFTRHCLVCWADSSPFLSLARCLWTSLPLNKWDALDNCLKQDSWPFGLHARWVTTNKFTSEGLLPSFFLLFEARMATLYLWLLSFPSARRPVPTVNLWLTPLTPGLPLTPAGNRRAREIALKFFFHSLCSPTLITFCCGKEMRWGLKTDHCPPPRLMQRKRYCLLNG